MLADPRFRWLTLAFAANTFAVIVVAVHLVPYLREHGHSAGFAAIATGALGALSVSGRLALTGAIRRWPVSTVTAFAFGVQAGAALLLLAAGLASTVTGSYTAVVIAVAAAAALSAVAAAHVGPVPGRALTTEGGDRP